MTTASAPADRYLAAFRSRRECCRALLELSAQQQTLAASGNYAELLELLAHKQQVLDVLVDPGRETLTLWQTWRQERDALPGEARRACEAILDEAEQMLQQLLGLEADSTAVLTVRRDHTEQLLRDVNQGRQALAAYQSPSDAVAAPRLDLDL
uniref:Flagellar protein FlgN n=1 Tax=Schlesneria paludicola TaxID=360056 RepID=A0A7C2NYZ2_9PLAN